MRKLLRKYPILGYYFNKLFTYFITIFGALTITFFMFRLIPTNPIQNWVKSLERQYSVTIEGGDAMINRYKEQFGLTGTLWEQYVRYMYQLIVKGDLGPSFIAFPTPVAGSDGESHPVDSGAVECFDRYLLGVGIADRLDGGMVPRFAGQRYYHQCLYRPIAGPLLPDRALSGPLHRLPVEVVADPGAFDGQYAIGWNWDFIKSVISHSILPALAIVMVSLSSWILSTRSLVISNIGEDYLLYAEAKGLKPWDIMVKYALRNTMLPQATGLALTMGAMMNGQLLIENMFVYPGLGQVMGRAIAIFDYNTMMGIIILSVVSVMTASLAGRLAVARD